MAGKTGRATFGHRRKLPSGRWQASYVGPDSQRHNAPMTFDTALDADDWLAARRTDIARGQWHRPALSRQRFDDYSIAWLSSATLRPKTRQGYASLLDVHILPTLGPLTLAQIDPTTVRAWWAERTRNAAPTARARAYSLLRTIMNEAIRDGALTANPCTIRGAASSRHPERTIATVAQLAVIEEAWPDRYRFLVPLAAWSQCRFGELTELRRGDIRWGPPLAIRIDRAVSEIDAKFVVGPPKGTDEGRRTVHLPEHLRAGFEAHVDAWAAAGDDALVFATRNGTYLGASNASGYMRVAAARAGLPGMHFHDLRHTGATTAAQAGATTKELMARMGQKTARAALIYQHAVGDRDIAIAEALNETAKQTAGVVPLRAGRRARDSAREALPDG